MLAMLLRISFAIRLRRRIHLRADVHGVQAVTTQVAELAVTAPVGITHPVIKQYQAFIRQFAWIAVREMASMRAGEQKKHLMLQYKSFINIVVMLSLLQ
jgi:hypothetical protein